VTKLLRLARLWAIRWPSFPRLESQGVCLPDERQRIVGAKGKRPVLRNLTIAAVERFRRAKEVVNLVGMSDLKAVLAAVRDCATRDPGIAPPFAGSRDKMQFVTVLPDVAAGLPVRHVEAGLLVDSSHRLVLRWRPWIHAVRLRPVPPPVETELLRGVQGLELAFWHPGSGWVASWRNEDLPALIRIRVLFPPGDPRQWPDIVAAPALRRP